MQKIDIDRIKTALDCHKIFSLPNFCAPQYFFFYFWPKFQDMAMSSSEALDINVEEALERENANISASGSNIRKLRTLCCLNSFFKF